MASGNIYIDPDRVVDISRQIGKAGEELEALRRSIVPQVNEVISMSYPSLQEMPMVAYPLNSTQENISVFNYRAQVLAQDLRTAGLQLNQIAEAGRTMIEQLTRQATLFGAGGQGNSSGSTGGGDGKAWWQTIGEDGKGILDVEDFIQSLTEFFKIKDMLTDTKLARDLLANKYVKLLAEFWKSYGPILDKTLFGVNLFFDLVSHYNPHDSVQDMLREEYATVVGDLTEYTVQGTGIGLGIILLVKTVHYGGSALSWGQKQVADSYGGSNKYDKSIREALQVPAQGLQDASDNADADKVFHDFGKYVVDKEIIKYSPIANLFGVPMPHEHLNQDRVALATDTAKVIYSVPQLAANMVFADVDDKIADLNQTIQYSSLPPSFKTISKANTLNVIQDVNKVANFINTTIPNTAGNIYRQVAPLANRASSMYSPDSLLPDPLSPFPF